MKPNAALLTLTLLLGLAPAVCCAQDFSADVVYVPGTSARAELANGNSSRIYVSNEKMRLETRGSTETILLVNGTEHAAFALLPATKEYEPLSGGLPEYFRVMDAENACADWQNAAAEKIACEKAGHEMVAGRRTVKYKNRTASESSVSAVWIDLDLKFVIKWESTSTGAELRNLQQVQQPAGLFTLPADYEMSKPRKGSNKGFSHRP